MPFPSKDEWIAPWKKSGEDFDAERAEALVYNLQKDAYTLKEAKGSVEAERDVFKAKVEELARKDETEAQKLIRERDDALEAARKAKDGNAYSSGLRYKVALDKGLTASQAKRLVGSTEEELTADADEMLKDLGVTKGKPAGDDEPDENPLRRLPQRHRDAGLARDGDSSPMSVDEYLKKHAPRR